jgi:NAD(P)-dependent dehydrogenase (short-subunit alcohol dehydrogenase family)
VTVAVVTGATRGIGKGIALALGETGATVYVTGRSTVEEAAAEVTERGGHGMGIRTDHTRDDEVAALFERVGPVDLVVANAWGGYENEGWRAFATPFWEQPLSRWSAVIDAGLRAQYTTARFALPGMVARSRGLLVFTGGWDAPEYFLGDVLYDVGKIATNRLVADLGRVLKPHGVAVVGVYPGFTRTEAVVDAYAAEGKEPPAETHSPEFVGRAVVHVLADPDVMSLSGTGAQAATYAQRYGFSDVDGRAIERFDLPAGARLT